MNQLRGAVDACIKCIIKNTFILMKTVRILR